jgi:hypothetical protein
MRNEWAVGVAFIGRIERLVYLLQNRIFTPVSFIDVLLDCLASHREVVEVIRMALPHSLIIRFSRVTLRWKRGRCSYATRVMPGASTSPHL